MTSQEPLPHQQQSGWNRSQIKPSVPLEAYVHQPLCSRPVLHFAQFRVGLDEISLAEVLEVDGDLGVWSPAPDLKDYAETEGTVMHGVTCLEFCWLSGTLLDSFGDGPCPSGFGQLQEGLHQ